MGKEWSLVLSAAGIVAFLLIEPDALSENTFLMGFVNHEVLGLMSVILTVTLASVANIHLALNRIIAKKLKATDEVLSVAREVKSELRDNAWLIFWGFALSIVLLLIKGAFTEQVFVIAAVNGAILWILSLYILCMYDIYRVVFGIVDLEHEIGAISDDQEDYTSDSPPSGDH